MRTHPLGKALAVLVLVSACGGASGSSRFGAGLPGPHGTEEILALEHRMAERLNRDRKASGLPPLVYDEALADIGRAHSEDMRAAHFFSHDSPSFGSLDDRLDRAGYVAKVARENLAEAPDVDTAEDGLLASPHHHENIMAKDITRIGIGIVRGGVKDPQNLLFTQEFSAPARDVGPDEVVALVRSEIAAARSRAGLGPVAESPLLGDLARSLVSVAADDLSQSSLDDVAKRALEGIGGSKNAGLKGVAVGAARVYDGDDYEVAPNAIEASAHGIGVGARRARDERGRPSMIVLVLVGQ